MVQEKHCAPAFKGLWKLPTGFIVEVLCFCTSVTLAKPVVFAWHMEFIINLFFLFGICQSEEIFAGAIREVKEETGVRSNMLIISFSVLSNFSLNK